MLAGVCALQDTSVKQMPQTARRTDQPFDIQCTQAVPEVNTSLQYIISNNYFKAYLFL